MIEELPSPPIFKPGTSFGLACYTGAGTYPSDESSLSCAFFSSFTGYTNFLPTSCNTLISSAVFDCPSGIIDELPNPPILRFGMPLGLVCYTGGGI